MSNDVASVKPKIDNAYWFDFSEKMVSKGQETRDQAAAKLQNLVLWLWGIYTGFAALGFSLAGKALPLSAKVLIILASGALIAVYWTTVWVQMPVSVEFDPRSPTQIQKVYAKSVKVKNRRLQIALGLSVVAAIMVSLALVVASLGKEQKSVAPKFAASVYQKDGGRVLAITGTVGQTPKITVSLESSAAKGSPAATRSLIFTPTEEGLLQTSIPLNNMAVPLVVSLEWEDSTGTKLRLSREVREEARKEQRKQTTK